MPLFYAAVGVIAFVPALVVAIVTRVGWWTALLGVPAGVGTCGNSSLLHGPRDTSAAARGCATSSRRHHTGGERGGQAPAAGAPDRAPSTSTRVTTTTVQAIRRAVRTGG